MSGSSVHILLAAVRRVACQAPEEYEDRRYQQCGICNSMNIGLEGGACECESWTLLADTKQRTFEGSQIAHVSNYNFGLSANLTFDSRFATVLQSECWHSDIAVVKEVIWQKQSHALLSMKESFISKSFFALISLSLE